jgi:formylglycine-generating enzyme required for sulfatase activity
MHRELLIAADVALDHVPTGTLADRMGGMIVRAPKGMREIPSGEFLMGSDDFYPEERPVHSEQVAGFWIDEHPVTNAEFRRFVNETGYRTTAETAPDADELPDADPADLVPGSLVFEPSDGPVPLDDWRRWWRWTPGASWRTPEGPGSNLGGRERHPVVHVSYEDAVAYAAWSGKHLPTEIEWEYAARAGRPPTTYAWGDDLAPRGKIMANFWHGHFPWQNDQPPGKDRTSPVGTYPPNNWGLIDMIGNVWEWTTTAWTDEHANHAAQHTSCCAPQASPSLNEADRRVTKGGSHLCAPTYCARYRPAARQGQTIRSSTSHIGFRCMLR